MQKDIIYIDTDDDITAIIGKIKSSKDKIVALVPPKRVGVLQSAVNLRLLSRAATNANKHLVLVTTNKALIALAASSIIPVAKSLQSKPEIVEIEESEFDENEDIIDGTQLPVGDLVKVSDSTSDKDNEKVTDLSDEISHMNIDDDIEKPSSDASQKKVSKIKVPDFSSFRKKMFIGITVAILLISFFVWAIIYAPSATIIVTTNTAPAPVSATLKLGTVEATDVTKGTIQTVTKQIKKDISVQFDATGQKDLGEKSKGSVTFSNCSSSSAKTIASGTLLTLNGKNYSTQSQVDVGAGVFEDGVCTAEGVSPAVNIIAVNAGKDYDTVANAQFSVSGFSSKMMAISTDGLTGGTTKIATVVTAADIQKASQTLVDLSSNDIKQQLITQFANGEIVIADSFNIDRAAGVSVPAVDTEATGKAKLTSATTFTITAISKSEMQLYLNAVLAKQVGKNQKIFDDGIDAIKLSGYLKTDTTATINITTVGKIGSNIDTDFIKDKAKGKRYGDVQSEIGAVNGVSNVDIKFPYFWINTVPSDINKIDIQFILKDA